MQSKPSNLSEVTSEHIRLTIQPIFTSSRFTIKTAEQGVKYVQSYYEHVTYSSSVSIVNFEHAIAH